MGNHRNQKRGVKEARFLTLRISRMTYTERQRLSRRKQAAKNKGCCCDADLVALKRSKKVRY
jgi:hypothetical protein